MARTITGYLLGEGSFWDGNGSANTPNAIPITNASGTAITLNSGEFPIKITISGKASRGASINTWDDLYVSTGARQNGAYYHIIHYYLLCSEDGGTTLTHGNVSAWGHTTTWDNFWGTGLAGQTLHLFNTNGAPRMIHNQWEVKIYTANFVYAGDIITKAQFDLLRQAKGNTPTAATQGNQITAAIANTYNKSTVYQGNVIPASWYN